jgi:L-2-hydroxycarboxylate dehydrogenase (NAD+)
MLPGQIEAESAALSKKHGGLLFTAAEVDAFSAIAKEAGVAFDSKSFKSVEV